MPAQPHSIGASHESFWMPFTAQRHFQRSPRIFAGASGMHYVTDTGRSVLDAIAGLWCVNAGHGHSGIVTAIQHQAARLDFVSSFSMSHPDAFTLSRRLASVAPDGIDHVFFTNSGSEAVDTALKIARAYHHARGDHERVKFIGRHKAYHGVNFGGLSVGGIDRHKAAFGPLLPGIHHLSLPYDPARSGFSRGRPAEGDAYADELEELIAELDASTIAAVIVEPVTGSGGVYPPPVGYLERLRAICSQHGILLIFDEVITGFGRLGAMFGSTTLQVTPDIITCAKGMTNGAVPMGAALVSSNVYEMIMDRSGGGIELLHGYTYSAHPLACAAALAALDAYEGGVVAAGASVLPHWEQALHSLKGEPHVRDIRNLGLLGAIDLEPAAAAPGKRGMELNQLCFERDLLIRSSGDTILLSPPLIVTTGQIDQIFDTIRGGLECVA